jgi:rhodanese-related sulfurtransferase
MLIASPANAQKSFDEKLRSMYKETVPLIHPNDLAWLIENGQPVLLLDTRTVEEFKVSHLRNARFVDYQTFNGRSVKNINHNTPVVVYCAVGYRSERIGEKLLAMGFRDVKNLYGGIFEWVNKSYPVENIRGARTDSVHTYNKEWSQWLVRGTKVY